MRRIRLFTAAAAVSLAAALGPAAVSAAHAATTTAASHQLPSATPEVSMWSRPWFLHVKIWATCPSSRDLHIPGAIYQVRDAGIHIRKSPGGPVEAGIGRRALFASDWVVLHTSGLQCVAMADGKAWVLGVSRAGVSGWVRLAYLTLVRTLTH